MNRSPDPARYFTLNPLNGASFGARLVLANTTELRTGVETREANPKHLAGLLAQARGLLIIRGAHDISSAPELMVRISQLLGPEVEDYRETLTPDNMIHKQVPQILIVSNRPPVNLPPPARPDPALAEPGEIPVSYPHHIGWHTDQSFRRPPPDISLLYAQLPCPKGQGQTLFADATAAYETLPPNSWNRQTTMREFTPFWEPDDPRMRYALAKRPNRCYLINTHNDTL